MNCLSKTDPSRPSKTPEKNSGWRCFQSWVNAENCPAGYKNWDGDTAKSDDDDVAGDMFCGGDTVFC